MISSSGNNSSSEIEHSSSDSMTTNTSRRRRSEGVVRRVIGRVRALGSSLVSIVHRERDRGRAEGQVVGQMEGRRRYYYEDVTLDSQQRSSSSSLGSGSGNSDQGANTSTSTNNNISKKSSSSDGSIWSYVKGIFYPFSVKTELVRSKNVEVTCMFEIPKQCLVKPASVEVRLEVGEKVNPTVNACFFLFLECKVDGLILPSDMKELKFPAINAASVVRESFSNNSKVLFVLTEQIKEITKLKQFKKKAKGIRLLISIRRSTAIDMNTLVEECDMGAHFKPILLVNWYSFDG